MMMIVCLILAYLIGSLSMGIILSKFMDFPDPRTQGSGSAGATNVLRISTKNQALMVLVGDAAKGFVAVLVARILGVQGFALGLAALAAVIGHVFPIYFKFKGGKGVATSLGTLFGLSIFVGLIAVITWGAVAFITRYSSLASIVTSVLSPVYIVIFSSFTYLLPVVGITLLILWKHLENIQRLKAGNEDKINFDKVEVDKDLKNVVDNIQKKSSNIVKDLKKKGEDLAKKVKSSSDDEKKS